MSGEEIGHPHTIDLEKLLDAAGRHARRILVEYHRDQLVPVFLYQKGDGNIQIIGTPWSNPVEKQISAMAVKAAMQRDRATRYSFVCEAWMAATPKDMPLSEAKKIKPSQHPDKEECVIAFSTDGFHTKWRLWSIKRDKRGRVTALPPKDDDGLMTDENMSSWLTNLLGGTA